MSARPDMVGMKTKRGETERKREAANVGRNEGNGARMGGGVLFVKPLGALRCDRSRAWWGVRSERCGGATGWMRGAVYSRESGSDRYGQGGSFPYALAPNMVDVNNAGPTPTPSYSCPNSAGHVGGMHRSHLDDPATPLDAPDHLHQHEISRHRRGMRHDAAE